MVDVCLKSPTGIIVRTIFAWIPRKILFFFRYIIIVIKLPLKRFRNWEMSYWEMSFAKNVNEQQFTSLT